MDYQAVIFDFDYTLGDATISIVEGYRHGLAALGWPEPDREAVRRTVGYTLEHGYTMLTGDDDPEHQARFRALFVEAAHELQPATTRLFPGAAELLAALDRAGVPAAIVSTKRSDMLRRVLERQGALSWFRLTVGGEQVSAPKPHPEGLLRAMEALRGGAQRHHPGGGLRRLPPRVRGGGPVGAEKISEALSERAGRPIGRPAFFSMSPVPFVPASYSVAESLSLRSVRRRDMISRVRRKC